MALQYTLTVNLTGTQDEMAVELSRVLTWEAEVHRELGIGPGEGPLLSRGSDTKIIGYVTAKEVE